MIEQLLEKYLNTYKIQWAGGAFHFNVDVFVNPNSKDIKEARWNQETDTIDKSVRFLADNDKQKVYVWNAFTGLHGDIWDFVKKETGDSRKLYDAGSLCAGVLHTDTKKVEFESRRHYVPRALEEILNTDWSWADKYIPNMSKELRKL